MIRYGVLLAAVLGLGADTVTLEVGQYTNTNTPVNQLTLVFSGTISSRAGGEYVEVLGRDCGARGDRLISGTQTTGGGSWRVEDPDSTTYPPRWNPVYSGTTFRARWKGKYCASVLWRLPAQPRVIRTPRSRVWVVHMAPATPTGQVGFQGKTVVLQRLSPGGWVRVRSARLVRKQSYNYEASFRIPTRGLKLRAYLPEQSAAPCFLPGASATWRS